MSVYQDDKAGVERTPGYPWPNTTPVPDDLLDFWMARLSGAELKVLLYIVRRTYGFKKLSDRISIKQIASGITKKDGEQLDRGTGLSQQTVCVALRSLEAKGHIVAHRATNEKGEHEVTTYELHHRDPPQKIGGPSSENWRTGPQKIGGRVLRKSEIQETVRQETDLQETVRQPDQPDMRASTRDTEPEPGLAGLGLQPLDSNSTRGDETELQAMWRTVHAITAILDDPAPSDEELGNYFVGVQENWYYNGTSRPADLLAVAREQRAGTRWPPASKSAQFRVYARNRTGRGDLNPRAKTKSGQNGHAPAPASNPAWNDRPADTWHDPEADRLHAITMARMGIDENGNEITPAPDQKGPAA